MSVALVLNVLTAWITVFCPVTQTGNGIGKFFQLIFQEVHIIVSNLYLFHIFY